MRASESPFQNYKSKQILSFANLICSSAEVRTQSANEMCMCFAILSYSEKLANVFEIVLDNVTCLYKNRSHWKNLLKEKIFRHIFVVYVLIYPLSKFGGNQTNSLWLLALDTVPFKWKNWIERTTLHTC